MHGQQHIKISKHMLQQIQADLSGNNLYIMEGTEAYILLFIATLHYNKVLTQIKIFPSHEKHHKTVVY